MIGTASLYTRNGAASSITGTSVTRAGGGGGGSNGTAGTGGNGGGGQGAISGRSGANGTANTGSGGGGCQTSVTTGGNGGSGVVILKYPDTRTIVIGSGLTGTTSTSGSYKVTTITAGTGNVSWT